MKNARLFAPKLKFVEGLWWTVDVIRLAWNVNIPYLVLSEFNQLSIWSKWSGHDKLRVVNYYLANGVMPNVAWFVFIVFLRTAKL